uniref:IclR family transcriptional regulator domain-containing protein n=1 Tax=uncultured Aquincola sp. TaxID=886556 RepID=UPI0032B2299E
LAEVRRRGLARAVDLSLPGVSALAVPVFDGRGAMVLSITAIGPSATFDSHWDGTLAAELRRVAGGLSRRLGWQPG